MASSLDGTAAAVTTEGIGPADDEAGATRPTDTDGAGSGPAGTGLPLPPLIAPGPDVRPAVERAEASDPKAAAASSPTAALSPVRLRGDDSPADGKKTGVQATSNAGAPAERGAAKETGRTALEAVEVDDDGDTLPASMSPSDDVHSTTRPWKMPRSLGRWRRLLDPNTTDASSTGRPACSLARAPDLPSPPPDAGLDTKCSPCAGTGLGAGVVGGSTTLALGMSDIAASMPCGAGARRRRRWVLCGLAAEALSAPISPVWASRLPLLSSDRRRRSRSLRPPRPLGSPESIATVAPRPLETLSGDGVCVASERWHRCLRSCWLQPRPFATTTQSSAGEAGNEKRPAHTRQPVDLRGPIVAEQQHPGPDFC